MKPGAAVVIAIFGIVFCWLIAGSGAQVQFETVPIDLSPKPMTDHPLGPNCSASFTISPRVSFISLNEGEELEAKAWLCRDVGWEEGPAKVIWTHTVTHDEANGVPHVVSFTWTGTLSNCNLADNTYQELGYTYMLAVSVYSKSGGGSALESYNYDTGHGPNQGYPCSCGSTCSYELALSENGPYGASLHVDIPVTGGNGEIYVRTATGCAWSGESNDPSWLSIAESPMAGPGHIHYSADNNSGGPPRDGTASVAFLPVTVHQDGDGEPADLRVSPTTLDFGLTSTRKTLDLWNDGGGLIDCTLSVSESWIGLSSTRVTLGAGHETVAVTVRRSGKAPGHYPGSITIRPDVGTVEVVDVSMDVPSPTPALGISKTGPSNADIGDDIEFEVEVSNVGTVVLHDVEVSDPKLGFSEIIASLGIGETLKYVLSYGPVSASDGAKIENTAAASCQEAPTVTASHTVTVGSGAPEGQRKLTIHTPRIEPGGSPTCEPGNPRAKISIDVELAATSCDYWATVKYELLRPVPTEYPPNVSQIWGCDHPDRHWGVVHDFYALWDGDYKLHVQAYDNYGGYAEVDFPDPTP